MNYADVLAKLQEDNFAVTLEEAELLSDLLHYSKEKNIGKMLVLVQGYATNRTQPIIDKLLEATK